MLNCENIRQIFVNYKKCSTTFSQYTVPTAGDVGTSHSAAYEQQGSRTYIVSVARIHGNLKAIPIYIYIYNNITWAKFRIVTKIGNLACDHDVGR